MLSKLSARIEQILQLHLADTLRKTLKRNGKFITYTLRTTYNWGKSPTVSYQNAPEQTTCAADLPSLCAAHKGLQSTLLESKSDFIMPVQ